MNGFRIADKTERAGKNASASPDAAAFHMLPCAHNHSSQKTGSGFMGNMFFDYNRGKWGCSISDQLGMDFDGNMIMKTSDNTAIDFDSGEIHMISSWPNDVNEDETD